MCSSWLPIVAAAQMTKKHGAEKEFLTALDAGCGI